MFHAIAFGLKYLPLIIAAVQFIENFVNKDTPGEEKKALACGFIIKTLKGLGVAITPRTEEIIGGLINLSVTILNAFGFFRSEDGPDLAAIEVASPEAIKAITPEVGPNDEEFERLTAALTRK